MPKRSIRAKFLAERKTLSEAFCIDSSRQVQQQFLSEDVFKDARSVALYSAFHNEVSTELVAQQTLRLGKTLAYPRVDKDDLRFIVVQDLDELTPGAFGVLEPSGQEILEICSLDLVVVPGVVFDQKGHRLGYGRGFYDRALAGCVRGCTRAGFAYDFQLIDELPSAGHDELLTMLVTEKRILRFHD